MKLNKIISGLSHILAFGFNSFELMLAKSIFITVLSIVISSLYIGFFRIMKIIFHNNYQEVSILNFLALIPIVFFIISLSVFLTYRYRISRPIRVVFIVGLLIVNEYRELIVAILKSNFVYTGLVAVFILLDIVIIKILGSSKNEDII